MFAKAKNDGWFRFGPSLAVKAMMIAHGVCCNCQVAAEERIYGSASQLRLQKVLRLRMCDRDASAGLFSSYLLSMSFATNLLLANSPFFYHLHDT
jgi:hypothetical protein